MSKPTIKSKWAGIVAFLGISGVMVSMVLAVPAFTPKDQPIGYIAQTEITNFKLTSGSETLFKVDYERQYWSGNLRAIPVDAHGTADTTVDRWTKDTGEMGMQWQIDLQDFDTGRKIATMKDDGTRIAFRYTNLSATQKTALVSTEVVDFLRGDRSNESNASPTPGTLRTRKSALGDMIHCRPFYVPQAGVPTLFVGANDGMLHAIDATTSLGNTTGGMERWAYVPSMLSSKLKNLAVEPYDHDYYVDGQINIGTGITTSIGPLAGSNRRVLVGGLGGGGKGLYALDITSMTATTESDVADKILWEITPTTINYATPGGSGGATSYANLGYTYGTPVITKVWTAAGTKTDAVIIGNGYNNGGDYQAYLLVIKIADGQLIQAIKAGTGGTVASPNGIFNPSAVDTDGDGVADRVYGGDLNGTMWKFDLSASNPNSWSVSSLLVTSPAQSITGTPGVAVHPNGGYMVTFGTGKLFTASDMTDTTAYYVYGIWDGAPGANTTMVTQTLTEKLYRNLPTDNGIRVRKVTANQPNWTSGHDKGWKVALAAGERVLGEGGYIENGRFYFTSYNPTITMVPEGTTTTIYGENWLMELDYLSGGTKNLPFLDLNGDVLLTDADRIKYAAADTIPVGKSVNDPILTTDGIAVGKFLANGVMSQPILVQLQTLNDTLFSQNPDVIFPPVAADRGIAGGHFDVDVYYYSGSGATATATLTPGPVNGVTLTAGGTGYNTAPTVSFSGGGGGSGAAATITMGTGPVNSLTVTSNGNYTDPSNPPNVSISAPGGSGVTATASASVTGRVTAAAITPPSPNTWAYSTAPAITFNGSGGGSGATGTGVLSSTRQVVSLSLSAGGSGYTSVPTVSFSGGGGSGATATAVLATTAAVGSLTGGGGGTYTVAPTLSFSGGGGTGAAATASITKSVASISGGGGTYSVAPTVTIAAPPSGTTATATATITKAVASLSGGGGGSYTVAPAVTIAAPASGTTATATASLTYAVASLSGGGGGSYSVAPTVSFSGGGGSGATATATITKAVASLSGGTGGTYSVAPTVNFTGGGGSGAAATATITKAVASLSGGTGGSYSVAPTVSFSGGGGSGAAATASISKAVASFSVTAGGSNYTSAPTVSITGGGGSGATASATITGIVSSITRSSSGSGYTNGCIPTLVFSGGGGSGAAATAGAISSNRLSSTVTVTNGGTGYTSAPLITATGCGGSGGVYTPSITKTVNAVTIGSGGSGYTSTPTVSFSGGGGTGAAATAVLAATGSLSLTLTAGGSGYTTAPSVSLVGGTGSGASAASATLATSGPISVSLTAGGSGYTSAPAVSFSGGTVVTAATPPTAVLATSGPISFTLGSGGSGYTSAPTVSLSGGTSTLAGTAPAAVLATSGAVSVSLTSGGSGYTSAPTVSLVGGTFTVAGTAPTAVLASSGPLVLTLGSGGSGYTTAPAVSFSGGTGSGASGSTTLASGGPISFTLTSGGSGYSSAPTVSLVGGTFTVAGTAFTAVLAGKAVASLTLTGGGTGYTGTPTVTLSGGGGSGATATATTSKVLTGVTVTGGGSGYSGTCTWTAPSGGNGTCTISNILSLTLIDGGSGYSSAPTVTISGGTGSGGAATATISRSVTGITLTSAGSGYTVAPTISLSGGGGSGATATAQITDRSVAFLTITNGGSNYPTAPGVVIESPAGGGATATATTTIGTVAPDVGKVKTITLVTAGATYSSPPAVIIGGGSSGGCSNTTQTGHTDRAYGCRQHFHEYDDIYNVTGVNMLNASSGTLNLSLGLNFTTPFKVLVMNQSLNRAAQISVGSVGNWVSVQNFQTSAGLTVAGLPTYIGNNPVNGTASTGVSRIVDLVFNLPKDAFGVKDWWSDGTTQVGLMPTSPACVTKTGTDGMEPPNSGINYYKGPSGERNDGALTVQLIRDTTPESALELNVAGDTSKGYRIKDADFYLYVLAEYTFYWHHPNRICYGNTTQTWYNGGSSSGYPASSSSGPWNTAALMTGTGWTLSPPTDETGPDASAYKTPASGSADPTGLGFRVSGNVVSYTKTTSVDAVTHITTTHETTTYLGGDVKVVDTTYNANNTITIVTTLTHSDGSVETKTEIIADATGTVTSGGDERGLQARTGRISWHEMVRN